MARYTCALVALLASTAVARPQNKHQHLHASGSGGLSVPSSGPFSFPNATNATGPTGTSAPVVLPSTVTVVPLPVSSGGSTVAPGIATASGGVAASNVAAQVNECSTSPTTTTSTSTDFVTLTVTPSAGGQAGFVPSAPGSGAASSVAPFPLSNATVPTGPSAVSGKVVKTSATSAAAAAGSKGASSSSLSEAPGGFYPASSALAGSGTTSTAATSAAAASASSSSSSSSNSSSGSSSGSGLIGLAYNDASLTLPFEGSSASYAYNWGNSAGDTIASGLEFFPMLWGPGKTGEWDSALKSAMGSGSKHCLFYNEPDLSSQSNVSPSQAASDYQTYFNPYHGQIELIGPAVTNGGGLGQSMGSGWYQNFFTACDGQCKLDACAMHWYDSATNIDYFKSHLQEVLGVCQQHGVNKIYVTEFAGSGSVDDQVNFVKEVGPWMESLGTVGGYFYFMADIPTLLDSATELSTLGRAYAGK